MNNVAPVRGRNNFDIRYQLWHRSLADAMEPLGGWPFAVKGAEVRSSQLTGDGGRKESPYWPAADAECEGKFQNGKKLPTPRWCS